MDPTPSAASASKNETASRPRKVRAACNRCHAQKLRCVRNPGEVTCERCLKLHTPCRYGPRAPRASLKSPATPPRYETLPEAASTSTPNVELDESIICEGGGWLLSPGVGEGQVTTTALCDPFQGDTSGLSMHDLWSAPFCEPGLVNSLDQYGYPEMDLIHNHQQQLQALLPSANADTCPRTDDHDACDDLELSPVSVIRKLADLNVALHECSANLPSMPEVGVHAAGRTSCESGGQRARLFALDKLFRLTNEFIGITRFLTPNTSLSPTDHSAQGLPVVEYAPPVSLACQPVISTARPPTPFPHMDEATMLMVLSCHCLLVETYFSIFQMMQACIQFSTVPQIDKGGGLMLPRLQIGSVSAPQVVVGAHAVLEPGTTRMYMSLVAMFSAQLCEQLAGVMRLVCEVSIEPRSPTRCLFDATVTERTDRLGRAVDATQHLLQTVLSVSS